MSTDSINQFSVEDNGSVTESPPQSTKKCTRTTPCSQPNCDGCARTTTSGHFRDLNDDLEVTTTTPTIPPNHWIIDIINSFKEAIQDQDTAELAMLTERYQQKIRTLSDVEIKYDRTEIKQLNGEATKLLASILIIPIQMPPTPPPDRQTASRWTK